MREITKPDHIRRLKQDTDDRGETWQLRVEWDAEDGLLEIAEEKMTSAGPDAQPLLAGRHGGQINLRGIDYAWFLKAVAEVMSHRNEAYTIKNDGA